jgi:predicted Zn-dependent peptidase
MTWQFPESEFSFEERTCSNGMWAGCREVPGPDLYLILLFRAGRAYDPEGLQGISHLLEHMVMRTCAAGRSETIGDELERLSGRTPFLSTSYEFLDIRLRFPRELCREVLELIYQSFSRRSFEASDLEEEKKILLSEISSSEETLMAKFFRENRKLIYGNHVYAEPVGGESAVVREFSLEDLSSWAEAVLRGPNLTIAMVGGAPVESMFRCIEEVFGRLPGGMPVPHAPTYLRPIPELSGDHVRGNYDLPRVTRSLEMVFRSPGTLSRDFPLANFLFAYLDSGTTSRLFRAFRGDNPLCYNFGISVEAPRKCLAEHFSIYAADFPPGRSPEVVAIINREIDDLMKGRIEEDRLEHLRNVMLLRFYEEWYERLPDRAHAIVNSRISGMTIRDYYDGLLRLQSSDLAAFARRYLRKALTVEIQAPSITPLP